ncbi:hypothetical protein J6590_012095 [Homalodisca vitripennis]|nr:hypothetical protein J6590_012095 [Homalodisca vitripennis]
MSEGWSARSPKETVNDSTGTKFHDAKECTYNIRHGIEPSVDQTVAQAHKQLGLLHLSSLRNRHPDVPDTCHLHQCNLAARRGVESNTSYATCSEPKLFRGIITKALQGSCMKSSKRNKMINRGTETVVTLSEYYKIVKRFKRDIPSVSVNTVQPAFKNLKTCSPCGIDGIPALIIKDIPDIVDTPLHSVSALIRILCCALLSNVKRTITCQTNQTHKLVIDFSNGCFCGWTQSLTFLNAGSELPARRSPSLIC